MEGEIQRVTISGFGGSGIRARGLRKLLIADAQLYGIGNDAPGIDLSADMPQVSPTEWATALIRAVAHLGNEIEAVRKLVEHARRVPDELDMRRPDDRGWFMKAMEYGSEAVAVGADVATLSPLLAYLCAALLSGQ